MAVSKIFLLAFLIFASALPCPAYAEDASRKNAEEQANARGLPAEVLTNHTLTLQGEKIAFTARAGAIRLRDAATEAPQVDVAYVAYERSGVDVTTRPVAFVFNGGPGAGSAWLGLGALSPWRLRFPSEAPSPSVPPVTLDNADSWIGFADLVFIDPPGTGFSKFIAEGDDARKRFFSVDGDAGAMAVVIRKWLVARGRLASPKYIVGESYGGFRAAKMLSPLRKHENIGVDGLFLVSPALDFSWLQGMGAHTLLSYAGLLPSLTATARGAADRAALSDVEAYASGDYVVDLLKGAKDAQALARLAEHVSYFTGLDRQSVARLGGRVDARAFARERGRGRGRGAEEIVSAYDGTVIGYDPEPFAPTSDWEDPVLDSWRAPLGAAMTRLTLEKLAWPIGEARYQILNSDVAHRWDYGRDGRAHAEALSDLREALALDPRLKLYVLHGAADMVTPYFATKLMLDQFPTFGDAGRMKLFVIKGGHMPYLYDESRKALRDAGKQLIEGR